MRLNSGDDSIVKFSLRYSGRFFWVHARIGFQMFIECVVSESWRRVYNSLQSRLILSGVSNSTYVRITRTFRAERLSSIYPKIFVAQHHVKKLRLLKQFNCSRKRLLFSITFIRTLLNVDRRDLLATWKGSVSVDYFITFIPTSKYR